MQSIQAQISLPNWLQNAINFYQAENTKTLTNNKFSKTILDRQFISYHSPKLESSSLN
jgi:hypothetical protein